MDLTKLRINQLSDAGWTWYQEYLEALDAYDLDRYTGYLSDDASIQFNNDSPIDGKNSASKALSAFWGTVTSLGYTLMHQPLNIYGTDQAFVLEALNHYDRSEHSRVTVRAVAFTDRAPDGLVTAVRLYQDMSPVFATAY